MLFAGRFKVRDVLAHFVLALLGHECFTHTISDGALVKSLIGLDGHFDLITDTDEEETSLSTVDGDLSDKFIEALSEKLLTEGANTSFTRLCSLDGSIELILQIDNVHLGGRLRRDVTHPEGATFSVLSRRQDRVQVVLISLLFILASLFHLVRGCCLLSLLLLVSNARGDKDWVVVAHE